MPKIVHEKDKAETSTLSLPRSLWARVKDAVDRDFSGNRSDYFRSIVERDLQTRDAAVPVEENGPILEQLALRLCGEGAARTIREQSANPECGISERELLKKLIDAYVSMVSSGGRLSRSATDDRLSLVNGSNFVSFIKRYAAVYARQLELELLELRNGFPGALSDRELNRLGTEVLLAYGIHNSLNPSIELHPSQSITSVVNPHSDEGAEEDEAVDEAADAYPDVAPPHACEIVDRSKVRAKADGDGPAPSQKVQMHLRREAGAAPKTAPLAATAEAGTTDAPFISEVPPLTAEELASEKARKKIKTVAVPQPKQGNEGERKGTA